MNTSRIKLQTLRHWVHSFSFQISQLSKEIQEMWKYKDPRVDLCHFYRGGTIWPIWIQVPKFEKRRYIRWPSLLTVLEGSYFETAISTCHIWVSWDTAASYLRPWEVLICSFMLMAWRRRLSMFLKYMLLFVMLFTALQKPTHQSKCQQSQQWGGDSANV